MLSDRALLARLIAFDSVSRNSNAPLADFIADYVDRPGVTISRNGAADSAKVNLVAVAGPSGDDIGLTLSGHMDVVPADEPEWQSDPFALTARDGKLYGRGACDMKGFLALAINRFAALDARRVVRPVALLLTRDEELGTIGARHFVESWAGPGIPRDVLIGEPTEGRVVTMHKGHVELRITLRGVSAHSGYPHLGTSAIEPAVPVLAALGELRRELARERPTYAERFPEVPYAALSVGKVTAGTAINVVPDRCVIEIGIRTFPGMDSAEMAERVRATAARATDRAIEFEIVSDSPPMWLEADTELATQLKEITGRRDTSTVSYATDAGWLQTAGYRCVIFGPGSIDVAHKPNEFLLEQDFAAAGKVLSEIIRQRVA